MDPMIEQYCRAHRRDDLRQDWFSQFQRYLKDVIQPQLEQIEPLQLENEVLREELAALRQAQPEKRGPGRPRKVPHPQPEPTSV
jgi:regulator of replication initiation timing